MLLKHHDHRLLLIVYISLHVLAGVTECLVGVTGAILQLPSVLRPLELEPPGLLVLSVAFAS